MLAHRWLLLALLGLACACSTATAPSTPPVPTDGTSGSALSGELIVSAASSLTDAFSQIGSAFEARHPGVKVRFNFGSSAALATQIREGAPVGVFASADIAIATGRETRGPQVFATNCLVVAVPARSAVVRSYADLANPGVRLVLAGAEVPAGRYARESLGRADASGAFGPNFRDRVLANVRSEEANVRAVLTKVQLGEADAGIVYRTDIAAARGEVDALAIPPEYNVVAAYPIVAIEGAGQERLAESFVNFVHAGTGQDILAKHGFGPPPR